LGAKTIRAMGTKEGDELQFSPHKLQKLTEFGR
jgi:hypothetical protein